jgi:DNA-binding GntR family transcriptional regulator
MSPRALYQDVADRVRQRIVDRLLEPGAWINEQALCTEWGISRTPLREALKVLAAEGLVTMKVRRGAYVTEMSERDVREAYQLLALLESDAAAELARRTNWLSCKASMTSWKPTLHSVTPFLQPTSASICACWS